jgi:hypothetical protein
MFTVTGRAIDEYGHVDLDLYISRGLNGAITMFI